MTVNFLEDRILTKQDVEERCVMTKYFAQFPRIDYNLSGVNGNTKCSYRYF